MPGHRRLVSDLIYDVGMNDGADTAFYLHQGYRVVAIDADPTLVEAGRERFRKEIGAGRLALLNVGIGAGRGSATFWICEGFPVWNSFDRAMATKEGRTARAMEIETVPFGEILDEFGVPHYLKVDIEGYDTHVVRAVGGGPVPRYLSMEVQAGPDGGLDLLRELGYGKFKLIHQLNFLASRTPVREFAHKVITSAAYGRLSFLEVGRVVRRYTDMYKLARHNYEFPFGGSGPWGEGAAGNWMTYSRALAVLSHERERQRKLGRPEDGFWFDWHATG